MKVNNQHQQVLWYLINWKSFSLMEVINDSMFYKFQTRLGEIENEHGVICERSKKQIMNTFDRKATVYIYDCLDTEKAKLLMKKYD